MRLVVLDVDGTLVGTRSGGPFRTSPADWQWLPGRLTLLRDLHRQGVHIAIATNQGAVAFGRYSAGDIRREIQRVADDIGPGVFVSIAMGMITGTVPEYAFEDPLRKPAPGMIDAARRHFGVGAHETVMVGDRNEDREAAHRAGCHFQWAEDYFRGPATSEREIA